MSHNAGTSIDPIYLFKSLKFIEWRGKKLMLMMVYALEEE